MKKIRTPEASLTTMKSKASTTQYRLFDVLLPLPVPFLPLPVPVRLPLPEACVKRSHCTAQFGKYACAGRSDSESDIDQINNSNKYFKSNFGFETLGEIWFGNDRTCFEDVSETLLFMKHDFCF